MDLKIFEGISQGQHPPPFDQFGKHASVQYLYVVAYIISTILYPLYLPQSIVGRCVFSRHGYCLRRLRVGSFD